VSGRNACTFARPLYGRESIFLFSHTNEFCGKSKLALEARVAWIWLKWGRWVCEKGAAAARLGRKLWATQRLPTRWGRQSFRGFSSCAGASWLDRPPGKPGLEPLYLIMQKPTVWLLRRLVGILSSPAEDLQWASTLTKPAAMCRTAYWGCPEAGGGNSHRRRMGSVDGWPMASPTYEQREVTPRSGRRMAEAARQGPPPGAPRPHHPPTWQGPVRRTGALGNEEGESGFAARGAQRPTADGRCGAVRP
jgi:hypothetical protein